MVRLRLKSLLIASLTVSLLTVLLVLIDTSTRQDSKISLHRIRGKLNIMQVKLSTKTTKAQNTVDIKKNNAASALMNGSKNQPPSKTSNAKMKNTTQSKSSGKPVAKMIWKELPILTPSFAGHLGNQMFEYASTYAIAVSKNMSVYIRKGHELNRVFKLDRRVVTHEGCGGWHAVMAPCCDYYPTLEERIDRYKCQTVGHYLQSWKYFYNVSPSIRKQFTFKPGTAKIAQDKLMFLKQTYSTMKSSENMTNVYTNVSSRIEDKHKDHNVTFIGIHARRGDYLSSKSIKQGRITPPPHYYIRAMDYFRKIFSNPIFVAVSDSPRWLERNIKRPDVVVLGGNSAEADLCILSMCNHTIVSVGTFGWWAGFLAGGTTVYYQAPFPNKSEMSSSFKHYETDFIYQGWIGIK